MSQWEIRQGDCLELLREIPSASVDAVITDPPYIIGAISVGNGGAKCGTWADMENAAYWFAEWMRLCRAALKPTGHMLVFGNWRSIPTLIRALGLAGMPATSCMVWDKAWIGPAGPAQLRPRYEVVMFSAMPDALISDRSFPDIQAEQWMAGNMRKTEHPAEKPVALLRRLITLTTERGGLILDPFCGSGSTGIAAQIEGRRFVGIEREASWCEVARREIGGPLFLEATA